MIRRGGTRRSIQTAAALLGSWLVLGAGSAIVDARPHSEEPAEDPPVFGEETLLPGPVLSGVVEIGSGTGTAPTASGDGRAVVFQGPPADPASDPRASTVWLSDRTATGVTDLVPLRADVRPGRSVRPVISGDGCSVVMITEMALDVFRDDDSAPRWDAYRLVLPACGGQPGEWELVSITGDSPVVARGDVIPTDSPTVSHSGSLIAYTHAADHLAVEGLRAISLVDLTVQIEAPGRTVLAAGLPTNAPDTVYVHRGVDQPALSGDGRHLAFRSDAKSDNPVPRWGDGPDAGRAATSQVYVWDRTEPDRFDAVTLVSASFDGEGSATGASDPVLSRDGSAIAFVSSDTGLVGVPFDGCGDTCSTQVFHLDRDSDSDGAYDESGAVEMSLASAVPGTDPPDPGSASSMQPTLTSDGSVLAFVTKAPNLKKTAAGVGGNQNSGDLLRWDIAVDELTRIVPAQDISSRAGTYAHPMIDDTGRTVVYDARRFGVAGRFVRAMVSPPQLSLADVDMGSTLVGEVSDEWYLAIINDGPSSFEPFTVSVSDDHFVIDEEASSCLAGVTVPPGGDCVLRLTFAPTEPGRVSATLMVSELGFGAVWVDAEVSGAGGQPSLRIEPAGGDLGTVAVGSTSTPFFFDVTNTSSFTTTIASIVVAGRDPDDVLIVAENCLGRPFNPQAACSVGVVFSPTESGSRSALVEVRTTDDAYATFLVGGDGVFDPTIALSAPSVVVGDTVTLGGNGYPADTQLTVRFEDRTAVFGRATTNELGGFLITLTVPLTERAGPRVVVVESTHGVVGTVDVEVLATSDQLIGMPGFGLG